MKNKDIREMVVKLLKKGTAMIKWIDKHNASAIQGIGKHSYEIAQLNDAKLPFELYVEGHYKASTKTVKSAMQIAESLE
jgi:hypothetical protein